MAGSAPDYHDVCGEKLTISQASEKYQINKTTLASRMHSRKCSLEDAIFNFNSQRPRIKNGERFAHLVVLEYIGSKGNAKGNAYYKVRCDCGRTIDTLGIGLKNNKKIACNIGGCEFSREMHGLGKTKEHTAWCAMKQRCQNENNKSYKYYGGVGISVNDYYANSFTNFLNDIGKAPSPDHSIDRIDVTKSYERGNIRWATKSEQTNNRRDVTTLTLEVNRLRKILDDNAINY